MDKRSLPTPPSPPPAAPRRRSGSVFFEILRYVAPILILGCAVFGFRGLLGMRTAPSEASREPPQRQIEVVPVTAMETGFDIEVDGLVVPHRQVTISTEVGGRIVYKSPECRAGHFVRKLNAEGKPNVLIRIDDERYQLEVERLERQLQQADVAIEELDEEIDGTAKLVELARRDVELRSSEVQRVIGLGRVRAASQAEREQAESAELASRNAMVKLNNQHRLLTTRRSSQLAARQVTEVQLRRAKLDLSRTTVAVRRDSMVVQEMVEQDSYVQPGAALVQLEDTSQAEVRCNLRMEHLYWLWRTAAGQVLTDDDPQRDYELPEADAEIIYRLSGQEFVWRGRLSRYDGIGLDEKTRTIPCRVVVERPRDVRVVNSAGQASLPTGPPVLMQGMYVTVKVKVQPQSDVFRIPEQALQPGKIVWVLRNGRLKQVPVQFIKRIARSPAASRPVSTAAATSEFDALVHTRGTRFAPADSLVLTSLPDVRDGAETQDWKIVR